MQNQKNILIIEDEKSLREALVDILHIKNFSTIEAKNGREGVELALEKHPDLILLDIIMPEMDGMTALKKIRKESEDWGKDVPVIILTNLTATDEQPVLDAMENKSTYFLIKSDNKLHDIVSKIEDILK